MKRPYISVIIGLTGFLLVMYGIIFATGSPKESDQNGWRVASIGMIMMGFSVFLHKVPDWAPEWSHRFAPVYAWFWIVIGIIIFLLSWLQV